VTLQSAVASKSPLAALVAAAVVTVTAAAAAAAATATAVAAVTGPRRPRLTPRPASRAADPERTEDREPRESRRPP
jgi:hypothetical protein